MHGVVESQHAGALELLRRAGGSDHPGSRRTGELERRGPDAAPDRVHQDGLARARIRL